MTDEKLIVVIGRQFGSGGREVGKILSARLGLGYYDKEVLNEAARLSGCQVSSFDSTDERRPSAFRSFIGLSHGALATGHGGWSADQAYKTQSNALHEIADKGRCLIVGRTADYVLREREGLVSVFLHAPLEERIDRVMRRSAELTDRHKAAELVNRTDRHRRDYYNYFTGRNWGHADNYHLSLSTSGLTPEQVADILQAYIDVALTKRSKL